MVLVLQCEKELLRAMAAERILCERARQSVLLAQMKLSQLEEQIHHTKHKVNSTWERHYDNETLRELNAREKNTLGPVLIVLKGYSTFKKTFGHFII